MELLNQSGNIVDNASEIIDNYLNYAEVDESLLSISNFPCTPNQTQKKIFQAITETQTSNNSDLVDILNYTPKIYGGLSRKISKLSNDFKPFAECIIAFIDQWCINGGARDGRKYGYEICSTVRSWYVQQNIITGSDYKENGLSWSLYGNALSVNVYFLEEDQLSETNGSVSLVRKTINFEDNSAKVFIEDAQKWFNLHATRTGVNIKIYGAYPDTNSAIRRGKYALIDDYMVSNDTVFWAGLFSTYSNFTSWEYHPGLMPNDIWKIRQSFLNNSFVSDGNENLLDRIELCENITYSEAKDRQASDALSSIVSYLGASMNVELIKYLSTSLEIMEEDFISLYNLKVNINTSSRYEVESLFKWAKANQYSLLQTLMLSRLTGDVESSVLFYLISNEVDNDIAYNENGEPYLINPSAFTITSNEEGDFYLNCEDMFGDKLKFPFTKIYALPCDYMPDSSNFDLVDFSGIEEDVAESGDLLDNTESVGEEIEKMSSMLTAPGNGVNEFGPISSIEVDPRKLLYNADTLADSIFRSKNYNEMITPPNETSNSNSKAILDVTVIGKRLVANLSSKSNEMIQPDKI